MKNGKSTQVVTLEDDGPIRKVKVLDKDHTPSWLRGQDGTAVTEFQAHVAGGKYLGVYVAERAHSRQSQKVTMTHLEWEGVHALRRMLEETREGLVQSIAVRIIYEMQKALGLAKCREIDVENDRSGKDLTDEHCDAGHFATLAFSQVMGVEYDAGKEWACDLVDAALDCARKRGYRSSVMQGK